MTGDAPALGPRWSGRQELRNAAPAPRSQSDAGIRRAVRLGDGWHTTVAHEEGLRERVDALGRALAAAGRDRDGFTLSARVRADVARVARIAPRMRELGVDHLLVDLPAFAPDRFRDEVARLRELV